MDKLVGENVQICTIEGNRIFTRTGVLMDNKHSFIQFDDRKEGILWINIPFILYIQKCSDKKTT